MTFPLAHSYRSCLVLGLFIVSGFALPRSAEAKRHHHTSASPTYEVIRSVNEHTKTVTVGYEHAKDQAEKALTVNGFTEITVDGQKASLHDLKAGMKVQVDLDTDNVAAGLDATHVSSH